MKVLHLSLAMILGMAVVGSCNEEEPFDLASVKDEDQTADKGVQVNPIPDPGENGSYEGDPVIYKRPPPVHFVEYLNTEDKWTVNEKMKPRPTFTINNGTANEAQTTKTPITIARNKHSMSVPEIAQIPTPQSRTLGPVKQSGITAKSTPGAARSEDLFLANNRGLVDILLVVDNSGSMYYENTYIMRHLPELMKHIWRSDWRLGVITSGPGDSCAITTASVRDAANDTKLDFALDRSSVIYSNYNRDLGYTAPRYLDPYFYYKDYKWLSYCQYNSVGTCNRYCSSNDDYCMRSQYDYYNGSDYHNAKKERHKYNPLWGYFKAAVTLPKKSTSDNGNEQLLRKLRWALEGKTSTGCKGDWARENATVIGIVVTDEGHSCDNTDYQYCSIDAYKAFVTEFRKKHNFKTYGILGSKLQADGRTRSPNWDNDELKAFDGYVINHSSRYEGGYSNPWGYFKDLPNGFRSSSPPTRVASNYTSYYNKLNRYYGHRSLHLASMGVAEELRNIYSPLKYTPDTGSTTVRIGDYTYDNNTSVAEYVYADVNACRAGDTTNQGECYKVVNGAQGDAIELVNYKNMTHFDKKVKISYTYGGSQVNAVPFDNSWELDFAPDSSSVTVSVTLVDNTINTLSTSDYTISGKTLSVAASQVEQLVPEGSSITINYSSPVALNNSFTLDSQYQLPSGSDIVSNSVTITILRSDGTVKETLTNSGFSFNGSRVSFNSGKAPAAGESFTMSYKYWGDEITSYAYSRHANSDSSISLSCVNKSSSNRMVSCTHDETSQQISFNNDSQFSTGNVIEITETLQQMGSGVTLRDIDISAYDYAEDEEIKITLGSDTCSTEKSPPNRLTVSNGAIELAGISGSECVIINSLNSNPGQAVTVHYHTYKDLPSGFLQMDRSFFVVNKGKYKFEYWDVSYDGVSLNEFMIQDYKITKITKDGEEINTDDAEAMRRVFGKGNKDNGVNFKVKVTLYHAE